MKILYHATDYNNLYNILENGLKANSVDGLVYLAETSEDALKFICLRGYEKIVTFRVKIYKKDENKLIETFDHSYNFFKCRSFGYMGDIPPENVEPYMQYGK